jgi:hypothetical protein
MKRMMHIWPEQPTESDGKAIVRAVIERDEQGPFRLWFSVPARYRPILSTTCDPFAVAAIFVAMRESSGLLIHGEVSSELLRNLEAFVDVWSSWVPSVYSHIDISAEKEYQSGDARGKSKAIMAFSGGLDSCFTAYRHNKGLCGRERQDLAAGVMVHGFDIPLSDQNGFARAADKSRLLLESLGIEAIPMATNFRGFGDDWDDAHGAAVAACLMLFQNGFGRGVVASSFSYDNLYLNIPWGSNPLTDRLLSTGDFRITNDGSRFTRVQKLRQLVEWPEFHRHLRVCWEGRDHDRNCCACEKCIRNIIAYHALGMALPECFEQDVTAKQIVNVKVPDLAILFEYRAMLAAAKESKDASVWVRAIEKCVRRNERRLTKEGTVWSKVRSAIGVRRRLKRLFARYSGWMRREEADAIRI